MKSLILFIFLISFSTYSSEFKSWNEFINFLESIPEGPNQEVYLRTCVGELSEYDKKQLGDIDNINSRIHLFETAEFLACNSDIEGKKLKRFDAIVAPYLKDFHELGFFTEDQENSYTYKEGNFNYDFDAGINPSYYAKPFYSNKLRFAGKDQWIALIKKSSGSKKCEMLKKALLFSNWFMIKLKRQNWTIPFEEGNKRYHSNTYKESPFKEDILKAKMAFRFLSALLPPMPPSNLENMFNTDAELIPNDCYVETNIGKRPIESDIKARYAFIFQDSRKSEDWLVHNPLGFATEMCGRTTTSHYIEYLDMISPNLKKRKGYDFIDGDKLISLVFAPITDDYIKIQESLNEYE